MKKYSALVSAVLVSFFLLGTLDTGRATEIVATAISKEDAMKKYPPPNGKNYPEGIATLTTTGGFFQSPYSSRIYDCRKLNRGALVLDEGAKKVFALPLALK